MAIGKSNAGKGKKGAKKKAIDPYTKKEWYDVKAPAIFKNVDIGQTLVTKTQGTRIASDGLKGRVFEVSLADLNKDEEQAYRIMRFVVEDVQGKNCLTSFHGMRFSTEKVKSLIRKWQNIIEAHVDARTADGYVLRMFCIGFTKRRNNQVKKTSYALSSQIRAIRKKMTTTMTKEINSSDLKTLFEKLVPEVIGRQIERETQGIYPLQNVFIRKVKILKRPRFDLTKLMELHSGGAASTGAKVARPAEVAAAAAGIATPAAPAETPAAQ